MTTQEVLDQVRFLTKTSTTDGTGTDTNLIRILNDYHNRQIIKFVNTNEDKFGIRATTDLNTVANQEDYPAPSDLIRIKRLEVNYTGSSDGFKKLNEMDINDSQMPSSVSDIANYYSTAFPYYSYFGDYIYLKPVPTQNVSGGLKLWYIRNPGQISNASSSLRTPLEYHGYLAYGVAGEVARRQGNDGLAVTMSQLWEDSLTKIEKNFAPLNLDATLEFKPYPVEYT